jgi:peptidoglycan/LPS O-acetylase OafA/YrhL
MLSVQINRNNNFDLIRLFAACQVFFIHSYTYLHLKGCDGFVNVLTHFPGVIMFFAISGFLISSSYDRHSNLKTYFKNRFLRIYPALWVCLLFSIGILVYFGVINTSVLLTKQFYLWLFAQLSVGQFYTANFLRGYGVGSPNGSLWTIPVELSFYVILPIIVLLFKRIKVPYKLLVLIIASILFNIVLYAYGQNHAVVNGTHFVFTHQANSSQIVIYKLLKYSILPYLYCFLTGSVLYFMWGKVHRFFEGKFLIWILIYLLICGVFHIKPSYDIASVSNLFANTILACLTISAAFTLPNTGRFLKHNDISYGLYIYHFVIVNVFVQLRWTQSWMVFLFIVFLAVTLAICSWLFIEKPCLSLKNRSAR